MESTVLRRAVRVRLAIAVVVLACVLAPRAPLVAQSAGVVVISEIMYHPQGGGQELEYIELYNVTSSPLDLSGWFFSAGVSFVFPDATWLGPHEYLVVCADEARVRATYGIENAIGDWVSCGSDERGCALDNGGETIALSEHDGVVAARVAYNDRGSWPGAADGAGYSLELVDVFTEQDNPASWAASGLVGGSPGRPNDAAAAPRSVLINEALLATAGERWVELYNPTNAAVDLGGYYISDDRQALTKAQLPAGSVVASRGRLVVLPASLGLDLTPIPPVDGSSPRVYVALSAPGEGGTVERVLDARDFEPDLAEFSEARIPDGSVVWSKRAVPTRGEVNRVDVEDSIVINEIMYHPMGKNPDAEYLELYNRGTSAVDLSGWRLRSGFNFDFAPGTALAADGYLVIARNPDYVREVYGLPAAAVLGPDPGDADAVDDFGRLRDDGEAIVLEDAIGNVVDSVRYHDGGEWPLWPDGGGPSAELIDPFQDNAIGAAWDSSDDTAKSEVFEYVHEGTFSTNQPELHLALAHRGITVIDDLRLFERQVVFRPAQSLVSVGEEWKYFKGTQDPTTPRALWRQPDFDDSGWLTGATPIGFGNEDEATVLDDMRQDTGTGVEGYMSFFMRREFDVPDPASPGTLVLSIEFDDGFIAYLNGEEIIVESMREADDGTLDAFDARGRTTRDQALNFDLSEHAHLLVAGRNVLALQVHNSSISNRDARCAPALGFGEFVNEDGPSQIANGDFEAEIQTGLTPGGWMIEGTHVRSGRTLVEPLSGAASLKIVASAKGDNKVNRLEQTLGSLTPGGNYTIAFKARWLVGAPTLLVHGHNLASTAFDYPYSHRLAVPQNLGTPGAPNSVTLRQIAAVGSANLGPLITDLRQSLAVPDADQPVEVSARVTDPDGVEGVRLVYWLEDNRGQPGPDAAQEVAMAGPDPDDGRYSVTIPGQPLRTRVVFYLLATDSGGREARFPVDSASRTHPIMLDPENPELIDVSHLVYRHDAAPRPQNPNWHSHRFYMTQAQELQMTRQKIQSNDRFEGSFIFENDRIYHGTRIRFSGSPWARGGFGGSYRVYMPRDKPLHGSPFVKKFNMEDHQNGAISALERLSHYLIRHHGRSVMSPYSFQWLVQWQMNDRINTGREHVSTPNQQFIDYWFPDDDDGDMFEIDDRFEMSDAGTRANSVDARWTYPPMRTGDGEDKENYRWFFNTRLNKGADDYTQLIEGAKILDNRITPDEVFDEVVWDNFNIEQMLRVWSIRMNTDDWDTWGTDRGKNAYVYRPYGDGRWHLFAWDMELTYGDVNRFMPGPIQQPYSTINTGKFPDVYRLINRPRIKRAYYGIMAEMIDHQFNSAFLAEWERRTRAVGMTNTNRAAPNGFIDQRAARLRNILRTAVHPQVPFEITSPSEDTAQASTSAVAIAGRAPVDIPSVVVLVNGATSDTPIEVVFSDTDYFAWTAVVPLDPGANEIQVLGFNAAGSLLGTDTVTITATPPAPAIVAVDPGVASVGDVVRIVGSDLYSKLSVFFGATKATQVEYDGLPESLAAVVPAGVGQGATDVVLEAPGGERTSAVPIMIVEGDGGSMFVRGDLDGTGRLSTVDAIDMLVLLFGGGVTTCEDAADANDSGTLDITDPVYLLNFIFLRGPAPPPPFPGASVDPTDDALGCDR